MDKKEKILKAALRLFNHNGFDKTPTAQISKEAGVAIGTLFHYFSTKEELINSLYLMCKDSMSSGMSAGVEAERTCRSQLKRVYTNYIRWGMASTDEYQFFLQFCNSPYIREITRIEGESKFNDLVRLLKDGMDKEIIRDADLEYLTAIIIGFLNSNMDYVIARPELAEDTGFIEKSFDFLWNSIKM